MKQRATPSDLMVSACSPSTGHCDNVLNPCSAETPIPCLSSGRKGRPWKMGSKSSQVMADKAMWKLSMISPTHPPTALPCHCIRRNKSVQPLSLSLFHFFFLRSLLLPFFFGFHLPFWCFPSSVLVEHVMIPSDWFVILSRSRQYKNTMLVVLVWL